MELCFNVDEKQHKHSSSCFVKYINCTENCLQMVLHSVDSDKRNSWFCILETDDCKNSKLCLITGIPINIYKRSIPYKTLE